MSTPVIEAILARRSIRNYQDKKVPHDLLENIVNCGLNAPSARNIQPWHITVVDDSKLIADMNAAVVESFRKNPDMAARVNDPSFHVFHKAPQLFLICADKNNSWAKGDCGMLTQNILLAAQELGLGTCVVGFVTALLNSPDGKPFTDKLVPEGFEPAYAITIGYPNETPDAKPRESKVSWF